jgi:hypothetical protein
MWQLIVDARVKPAHDAEDLAGLSAVIDEAQRRQLY